MLPVPIERLESDELPAHVPVIGMVPDGLVMELPLQAAANTAKTAAANIVFM